MTEKPRVAANNRDYRDTIFSRTYYSILRKKLTHPIVIAFITLVSIFLGIVIAKYGMVFGVLGLLALVGVATICAIIAYPKFGVVSILTASYFIMYVIKLEISFPLGTAIDGMEVLLAIGFFIKIRKEKNWGIFYSPISFMIVLWISYNLLQSLNPDAQSLMAWLFTIRTVALVMITYFIFMLHCRDIAFIKFILKMWLAFAFFAAVYAAKQEYIGFNGMETNMLQHPETAQLFFQGGRWRKFSIFSDPVAFAYNMVSASLLCIGLLRGPFHQKTKIILGCIASLCMFTMLYSGTRGAYILIPATMVLFALLNFNKNIFIYGIIASVFFALLVVMPTNDPNIRRFQTAFSPSDDASFNVRKINQKRIQPFIQSHPFGGGLGSTGVWGIRFSPNSELANFPPDSGYVRVAVELGWFGLLLFCTLMFTILRQGIINYYRIKDPLLKSICLSMLLIAFALNLGNYPQEALVQFPHNIYFYLVVALIDITWLLDKDKQAAIIKVEDASSIPV